MGIHVGAKLSLRMTFSTEYVGLVVVLDGILITFLILSGGGQKELCIFKA